MFKQLLKSAGFIALRLAVSIVGTVTVTFIGALIGTAVGALWALATPIALPISFTVAGALVAFATHIHKDAR